MAYIPNIPDKVDAGNSTATPLGANATFTGTSVDCTTLPIGAITVSAFSDQNSAANGMQLQWSQDNSVWTDHDQTMTQVANVSCVLSDKVRARYYRVVFTNGSTIQGLFRLQTLQSATNTSGSVRDLDTGVSGDDEAQQVRAVLTGRTSIGAPTGTSLYTDVITDVYGSLQTVIGGQAADAFGRVRSAGPTDLFSAQFGYTAQPLLFQTSVVGTGTVAKTANESSLTLSTGGTASGAGAINQSKRYMHYEPGKSQQVIMTGVLGAQKANVRSRIGYFDANDGMYFEMDGTAGASVNIRTSTSGSPVNTSIAQANWNFDKLNGTGPSGITMDWSKAQVFAIDFQWLGAGRVRFGFFLNGTLIVVHQLYAANVIALPYTNTANLPCRMEIFNTGTAATTTTVKQICMTVISEGGTENPQGYRFSASNGVTPITIGTTRHAVLSIRPKLTFNSITNRVPLEVEELTVIASGGTNFWELVYNPTLGGTPAWNSVDTNSTAEFDVAATTVTGGTVLASGYSSGGGDTARGINLNDILGVLPVTLDITGSVQDILTVACTAFTGTNATNAVLRWAEVR